MEEETKIMNEAVETKAVEESSEATQADGGWFGWLPDSSSLPELPSVADTLPELPSVTDNLPDAQSSSYIGVGGAVAGAAGLIASGPIVGAVGAVAGGAAAAYWLGSFVSDAVSNAVAATTAAPVPAPAMTKAQELQNAFRKKELVDAHRKDASKDDYGDNNPINWNNITTHDETGELVIHLGGVSDVMDA